MVKISGSIYRTMFFFVIYMSGYFTMMVVVNGYYYYIKEIRDAKPIHSLTRTFTDATIDERTFTDDIVLIDN